jgi:hypothetical protein
VLEKQLTTRLDRSCLDKESWINRDNDSASCLFNGVHHIYNHINIAKGCEQEVDGNSLPDKITDILDKIMEYEPSDVVPNMDDHVFDDKYNDNEAEDDEHDMQIIQSDASTRPCLLDLTSTGWQQLENVIEVHQHHTNHMQRKHDTMKYILMQVVEMKTTMRDISICEENSMAEISTWSAYLNVL